MADTLNRDDPEAIERDIRRTQEDMSRTVDQIGDQLTPKKLFNALLDKADEEGREADIVDRIAEQICNAHQHDAEPG